MVKLLGGNPAMGMLVGLALLVFALSTGRVALALAGAFVLVASVVRWLDRPRGDERADDRPLPGRRR